MLVPVEGGVLLPVHEATRVAFCRLGEVGVRSEDVRVDVVSDNVLWREQTRPSSVGVIFPKGHINYKGGSNGHAAPKEVLLSIQSSVCYLNL